VNQAGCQRRQARRREFELLVDQLRDGIFVRHVAVVHGWAPAAKAHVVPFGGATPAARLSDINVLASSSETGGQSQFLKFAA
jgi:hypothetical protein